MATVSIRNIKVMDRFRYVVLAFIHEGFDEDWDGGVVSWVGRGRQTI